MKRVVVLGSTGSIGVQALEVIEAAGEDLQLVGISAHSSGDDAIAQADKHGVERVAIADPAVAERCATERSGVLSGPEGVRELVATSEADLVLNAITGSAGLGPTIVALSEGIDLALANKESLVVGGELITALAEATQAKIIPVDSEHSALFQLINAEQAPGTVEKLVLTASGGPFREREDLSEVTIDEALAHPTWEMGGRITIDSATLFNKGLELIEAHHLFNVPYANIDVVVHPQSIIHSLIHLNDGASLAHLGYPDMRVPDLLRAPLPRPGRRAAAVARPRAAREPDVRGARPGALPVPATGPRGGGGGRNGAVRPQRGGRGSRRRLPRRRDPVHGDRAGCRSYA